MIKNSMQFAVMFYLALTLWQWLFRPEIHWLDNLGLCLTIFVFHLFWEWVKKPYQYKRDK